VWGTIIYNLLNLESVVGRNHYHDFLLSYHTLLFDHCMPVVSCSGQWECNIFKGNSVSKVSFSDLCVKLIKWSNVILFCLTIVIDKQLNIFIINFKLFRGEFFVSKSNHNVWNSSVNNPGHFRESATLGRVIAITSSEVELHLSVTDVDLFVKIDKNISCKSGFVVPFGNWKVNSV